jgi:hypothetical protein
MLQKKPTQGTKRNLIGDALKRKRQEDTIHSSLKVWIQSTLLQLICNSLTCTEYDRDRIKGAIQSDSTLVRYMGFKALCRFPEVGVPLWNWNLFDQPNSRVQGMTYKVAAKVIAKNSSILTKGLPNHKWFPLTSESAQFLVSAAVSKVEPPMRIFDALCKVEFSHEFVICTLTADQCQAYVNFMVCLCNMEFTACQKSIRILLNAILCERVSVQLKIILSKGLVQVGLALLNVRRSASALITFKTKRILELLTLLKDIASTKNLTSASGHANIDESQRFISLVIQGLFLIPETCRTVKQYFQEENLGLLTFLKPWNAYQVMRSMLLPGYSRDCKRLAQLTFHELSLIVSTEVTWMWVSHLEDLAASQYYSCLSIESKASSEHGDADFEELLAYLNDVQTGLDAHHRRFTKIESLAFEFQIHFAKLELEVADLLMNTESHLNFNLCEIAHEIQTLAESCETFSNLYIFLGKCYQDMDDISRSHLESRSGVCKELAASLQSLLKEIESKDGFSAERALKSKETSISVVQKQIFTMRKHLSYIPKRYLHTSTTWSLNVRGLSYFWIVTFLDLTRIPIVYSYLLFRLLQHCLHI